MYLDRLCVRGQVVVVTGGGRGMGVRVNVALYLTPLVTASVANVPRSPV